MSNSAYIARVRTQFLNKDGTVRDTYLGFKTADNEASTTADWHGSEQEFLELDDRAVVEYVSENSDIAHDIIDFIRGNYDGIKIDGEHVLWTSIEGGMKP